MDDMEKICFKCEQSKPMSSFYPHPAMGDGHLGKCKECTKLDARRRYYDPEGRKRIIAYELERQTRPERKAKATEYQRRRRAKTDHDKARHKVWYAVKHGKLQKKPCERCGVLKVEAHHADYSKPLDVMWLCRRHHLEIEGKLPF